MTSAEFSKWLDFHCELHPEVDQWFRKLKKSSQIAILEAWYESLEFLSDELAKDASRRMLCEVDHPDHWHFNELPKAILQNSPRVFVPRDRLHQYNYSPLTGAVTLKSEFRKERKKHFNG